MLGKKVRMKQLFPEGKMFIVPMDHSVSKGPINGLENYIETIKILIGTKVNCVVLHKGTLKQVLQYDQLCGFPYILHLSASIEYYNKINEKVLVADVDEAIKFGALGVSIHINLYDGDVSNMLKDLGIVSKVCDYWGMPLLVMMYPIDKEGRSDKKRVIHAARLAEELGADIVKVPCVGEEILEELVKRVSIPIVVSGGNYDSNLENFLDRIETAMKTGISGVAIGRNVFQQSDIMETARQISTIIMNT